MSERLIRHLVLDTEAASALLSQAQTDPKRAAVVQAIAASSGQRVVPTAVRAEAGWDRTDPRAANANRLLPDDDPLDRFGANRAAQLRAAVSGASVVDASVALAAERVGAHGGVVEVLTSDVPDLRSLSVYVRAELDVVRL